MWKPPLYYTKPDGTQGVLPVCVHQSSTNPVPGSCERYCSCFLSNGHCPNYEIEVAPRCALDASKCFTNPYATVDACMQACDAYVAMHGGNVASIACYIYRADNDAFHCGAAVLGNKCP